MARPPSLRDLLLALYDSMQAARDYADHLAAQSSHQNESTAVQNARELLSLLGSASVSASSAFAISELTLSFDCELRRQGGKYGLALRRPRFWRSSRSLPLQIRLYGSQPLKTEVLLDGRMLHHIAGRPTPEGNGSTS